MPERRLDRDEEGTQDGLGGMRDVREDTGTESLREEVFISVEKCGSGGTEQNDVAAGLSLRGRRRKSACFALTFSKRVEKGSELHQKAPESRGKAFRLGKKLLNWGGEAVKLGGKLLNWEKNY